MIWELALIEALGRKRTFSIIMEYGDLAYPRALLPSGGPLSREFWQLTTPLMLVEKFARFDKEEEIYGSISAQGILLKV